MGKFELDESITVNQLLQLAERAEQTMRDCGPFDIAYGIFKRDRDFYLKLAVEKEQSK